jgi:uncharacterized protein YfaT (DUF1175 family)
MSIYSGFGTRQEESVYNSLVESTIKLLQSKVMHNLKGEEMTDPLFKIQVLKNYELMIKLEKHKYLEPKFSEAFREVVVRIVKDQVSLPPDKVEIELLKKSSSSFRVNASNERALTPTLPTVKTHIKLRNYTPIKNQKSDTCFLFARLKNPQ